MSVRFPPRPFDQFADLLLQLHALELEGMAESPPADVIRESMEGPWSQLTEREQLMARALSAGLHETNPAPEGPGFCRGATHLVRGRAGASQVPPDG